MRKRIKRVKVEQVKPNKNDTLQGERLGKIRVCFDEFRPTKVYSTK